MKTTKFISACAVLVALASCSSDHELSQQSAENTPIRIQANVGGITTRAASNIQGTQFETDERVNVYIYENTENNDGSSSGKVYGNGGLVVCTADGSRYLNPGSIYYPQNGNGIDVYGVYPTSVTEKNSAQDFSVNTDQSEDDNYKASDLMYASCETNHTKGTPVPLTFQHKLSKVTVELIAGDGFQDTDLNNAVVKITNTSTKCSIASLNKSGIGAITASSTPSDIKPITIGTWNSNAMSAIVIPQTVNAGETLFEVTLVGGTKPYKYKIPAGLGVTFSEGKVYNYRLTVKIDGIEVQSTITDWVDDTENLPDEGIGDATLD